MINFVVFQIGWFVAILGAAYDYMPLALLLLLPIIGINLYRLENLKQNSQLLLLAVLLGLAIDSLAISLGLLSFKPAYWWPYHLAPLWMTALWALFATTINGYLKWINDYPLIGLIGAAIGGPLAYIAGEKLAALQMTPGWQTIIYLAITWTFAVFILLRANRYLKNRHL